MITVTKQSIAFAAFIDHYFSEALAQMAIDVRRAIAVEIGELEDGMQVASQTVVCPCSTASYSECTGEARVIFRGSGRSVRFNCQVILDTDVDLSGFCGFAVRGRVDVSSEEGSVCVTSRTNRYNNREWDLEFRCD